MPVLNFDPPTKGETARAVARVRGGKYDKDILYLHEGNVKGRTPTPSFDRSKYVKMLMSLKPLDRVKAFNHIEEALSAELPTSSLVGEDKVVKDVYDLIQHDVSKGKGIKLDEDGMFDLLPSPDPHRREVWYIAGASGSGKSYVAKGLGEYYRKLFPEREVYLISKLEPEKGGTIESMAGGAPKRIKIDSLIVDYPSLDEFKDCMVIFDDYDTFTGDAEKTVTKLIDDLATMGRHTNTTMLCLSHYLTQYKKTRLILNEATHIVVYPQATSYHALLYLLKNYVGVDEEDIKQLRKCGSRWLCFGKNFPQYVITQQSARLLHTD